MKSNPCFSGTPLPLPSSCALFFRRLARIGTSVAATYLSPTGTCRYQKLNRSVRRGGVVVESQRDSQQDGGQGANPSGSAPAYLEGLLGLLRHLNALHLLLIADEQPAVDERVVVAQGGGERALGRLAGDVDERDTVTPGRARR